MRRHTWARYAALLWLLAATAERAIAQQPAAEPENRTKFLRLQRSPSGDLQSLQTAVVRYVSDDPKQAGLAVDLVGAVHVGERAYYDALNKLFEGYDVVLYELVAPEGTKVPKGGRSSGHPIALLQNGLKDLLNLEHQLACVDYNKDNFVHADMSPEDFDKSLSDRNESMVGMFFRMMGQGIAQQSKLQSQGKSPELDILAALFDDDRAGAMKRLMAQQFENLDGMMEALEGPQGSTLLSERNKVALKKLSEQIADGKKKIAIFYGAGHLVDMEKRLLADFHLRRGSQQWLSAWKLEKLNAQPAGK